MTCAPLVPGTCLFLLVDLDAVAEQASSPGNLANCRTTATSLPLLWGQRHGFTTPQLGAIVPTAV